jgi:hypothetical protein
MEPTLDVAGLSEALTRVGETAAALEQRLAEIREIQKQIVGLIQRADRLTSQGLGMEGLPITVPSEPQELPLAGNDAATFTNAVILVFKRRPDAVLSIDEVTEILEQSRSDTTKERVRNALYYAAKQGHLHRFKAGKFTLRDTSTPVAAGVEDNEELASSSSREEGDRDYGSVPLRDQGGSAGDAQVHLDRVGDRASVGG